MASDPPGLTRTLVSTYRHCLSGAITAQYYLFSLGEDIGDVVINYLPAGLHPCSMPCSKTFWTLIVVRNRNRKLWEPLHGCNFPTIARFVVIFVVLNGPLQILYKCRNMKVTITSLLLK